MVDRGVQCCLNDAGIARLQAEVSYLREMLHDLKDEIDKYSNRWMFDYDEIVRNQIIDMTELVLKCDEEAPASSSAYHNTSR